MTQQLVQRILVDYTYWKLHPHSGTQQEKSRVFTHPQDSGLLYINDTYLAISLLHSPTERPLSWLDYNSNNIYHYYLPTCFTAV